MRLAGLVGISIGGTREDPVHVGIDITLPLATGFGVGDKGIDARKRASEQAFDQFDPQRLVAMDAADDQEPHEGNLTMTILRSSPGAASTEVSTGNLFRVFSIKPSFFVLKTKSRLFSSCSISRTISR